MELTPDEPRRNYVIGAWLVTLFLLWFALQFRLLAALLAGLLVFELVHIMASRLSFVREKRARVLAVAFLGVIVVGLLTLAIFGGLLFRQR